MKNSNFIKVLTCCILLFSIINGNNPIKKIHAQTTDWMTKVWNSAKTTANTIINSFSELKNWSYTILPLNKPHTKKCRNLILLLDPNNHEKSDKKSFALALKFIDALQEKTAPIIVTRNIVDNFCFWKSNDASILTSVKEEADSTKDQHAAFDKAYALLSQQYPTEEEPPKTDALLCVLLSLTDINDNDWYCYAHKQADLILLVPKNYLTLFERKPDADLNEQMKTCGFDITDLIHVTDIHHIPTSYLNNQDIAPISDLIDRLISMLIASNKTDPTTWNIYLSGHGNQGLSEATVPQTAYVAGLSFNDFSRLINFLDTIINTSYFHYSTCFGGGANQTFINDILSQLKVSYIVSAEGINESVTYGFIPDFKPNTKGTALVLAQMRFTNFFGLLENFFGDPAAFVTTKSTQHALQKDPIATIVRNVVNLGTVSSNQPFVRIPAVGVFNALTVDRTVKILTKTVAKAYELEERTIDFSDQNIDTAIIYPTYIGTPLQLNNFTAIVSPTPREISNKYQNTHIFETIKIDSELNEVIYNFICANNSYAKITFVIEELQCFNYENSPLDADNNQPISIKNMIIQVVSDLSLDQTRLNKKITIIFTHKNKNYSFSEHDIEKPNQHTNNLFEIFKESLLLAEVTPEQLNDLVNEILLPKDALEIRLSKKEITVPMLVEQFKKNIDDSFNTQKPGSLKKILLFKQLSAIEKATDPEQLQQDKIWREKSRKFTVPAATIFKRHNNNLQKLKTQLEQLELNEQDHMAIQKRIAAVQARIN